MKKSKRIGMSLFDDELKSLINASAKIFPVSQEDIDGNINPDLYEYGRVGNAIYRWSNNEWSYIIADDKDINWVDIKDKPTSFVPGEHTHSDLHSHPNKSILDTITQLMVDTWNTVTGKADKTYVDTELDKKSDTTHKHNEDYSKLDHIHNYSFYTESEVDSKLLLKSDTTHNHDGAYWLKTTPLPKGDKGDKPTHVWSGTSLAFELPNGVMGASVNLKGEQGEQGQQGEAGEKGEPGEQGIPGERGEVTGYTAGSNIQIVGTVISATDTKYNHPTTAGSKHIPTGGTVGQLLKNTASGTATWQDETIVDISGKSDVGHTHDDRYYTESEIDGKLATKAETTTISGHTGNATIHVTQGNKDTWNGKAELADIPAPYLHPSTHPYSMLTGTPTIPTNTNQLTNGSGFITIGDIPPATPGITTGAVKPTDGSMWYKVIG